MTEVVKAVVTDFYEISDIVLGKGLQGTVVQGKKIGTEEQVAIKIIKLVNQNASLVSSIRLEVETLKSLDHPNIVKYHDFFESDTEFHICLEKVKGGELFDRITQKKCYSERDARDLVSTLTSTVKHMHDRNIVHRDIKAENLLMVSDDDDADVKLVDFGFAAKIDGHSLDGIMGE